jgi:hypothetical protein
LARTKKYSSEAGDARIKGLVSAHEGHKDQILDEIIKVATKLAPGMVGTLEGAKKENHFSRAIDSIKDAIPRVLLIKGQNPLTLLHSALSKGLHAQNDEQCLELAHA